MSLITTSLKSISCFYKENGYPLWQVLHNRTDSSTNQWIGWAESLRRFQIWRLVHLSSETCMGERKGKTFPCKRQSSHSYPPPGKNESNRSGARWEGGQGVTELWAEGWRTTFLCEKNLMSTRPSRHSKEQGPIHLRPFVPWPTPKPSSASTHDVKAWTHFQSWETWGHWYRSLGAH